MFFRCIKLVIENMRNAVTNICGFNRKLQTYGLRKCGKCYVIYILSNYYTMIICLSYNLQIL